MHVRYKMAVILLALTTSSVLAQEIDPTTILCGDFMALDPETKGEVAIEIFAASVRVSALASIGGFGPVELIEKGCRDNGLQTATAAAEAGLDN